MSEQEKKPASSWWGGLFRSSAASGSGSDSKPTRPARTMPPVSGPESSGRDESSLHSFSDSPKIDGSLSAQGQRHPTHVVRATNGHSPADAHPHHHHAAVKDESRLLCPICASASVYECCVCGEIVCPQCPARTNSAKIASNGKCARCSESRTFVREARHHHNLSPHRISASSSIHQFDSRDRAMLDLSSHSEIYGHIEPYYATDNDDPEDDDDDDDDEDEDDDGGGDPHHHRSHLRNDGADDDDGDDENEDEDDPNASFRSHRHIRTTTQDWSSAVNIPSMLNQGLSSASDSHRRHHGDVADVSLAQLEVQPSPQRRPLPKRWSHRFRTIDILQTISNSLPKQSLQNKSSHRPSDTDSPQSMWSQDALDHMKAVLGQMLDRHQIHPSTRDRWRDMIVGLLLKICENIDPDISKGDDMDIRQYVKIKKIPGGQPQDCELISGRVTSKTAPHKKMLRDITNPRILLLSFALEYERPTAGHLSLDPVLANERDYIEQLVSCIAELEPSIVLVERSISRTALERFLKTNITVIPNVKASVLERLTRFTGASIVSSPAKLKDCTSASLGSCGRISFKTFVHPDLPCGKKSFMYFEGCPKDLGCTVVLRGENAHTLGVIKEIVGLMVYIANNLKLEVGLLQDQSAMAQDEVPKTVKDGDPEAKSGVSDETPLSRIISIYNQVLLSASPHVRFPPPYGLRKLRDNELKAIQTLKKQGHDVTANPPSIDPSKLKEAVGGEDFSDLLQGDAQSTPLTIANIPATTLDPFSYQSIMVLYSIVSNDATLPCHEPEFITFEYYKDTDMTLGQFLEELFVSSHCRCPTKHCNDLMLMHYRSYTHGEGRITVTIEEVDPPEIPPASQGISMWSFCQVCKQSTPPVTMSKETWKYSFGKFLELSFYHSSLVCDLDGCSHSLNQQHSRFYRWGDLVVRFEYDHIDMYEVLVPPIHVQPATEESRKFLQNEYEKLRDQANQYYDSLLHRAKVMNLDILPPTRITACRDELQEITKRIAGERKYLLQLLQQNSLNLDDALAINRIIRLLQENVQRWDLEFVNFMRTHYQIDARDLRRMTAAQIKKIFPQANQEADSVEVEGRSVDVDGPGKLHVEMPRPMLGTTPTTLTPSSSMILSQSKSEPPVPMLDIHRKYSIQLIKEMDDLDGLYPHVSQSPYEPNQALRTPKRGAVDVALSEDEPEMEVLLDRPMLPLDVISPIDQHNVSSSEIFAMQELDFTVSEISPTKLPVLQPQDEDPSVEGFDLSPVLGSRLDVFSREDEKVADDYFSPTVGWEAGGTPPSTFEQEFGSHDNEHPAHSDEKPVSIIKTLANLWTGNVDLHPLSYPFTPSEHIFKDSSVVVREDEPSSIISFTLSSKHYEEKLGALLASDDQSSSKPSASSIPNVKSQEYLRYSAPADHINHEIETMMLRGTGTHMKYQFSDGPTKLFCKIFFVEQFDALRRHCGFDKAYIESLSRCFRWNATGGKSGSTFLKTCDDRLILKQLSKPEMDALIKFAPSYFEYMSKVFFHGLPTVLTKIFGVYRIGFKNSLGGKSLKMDLLVMENLWYGRNISRIFDLKGSMRNRHVHVDAQSSDHKNVVLLDENLVQFINESPLFIRSHSKILLSDSVFNDTLFLYRLTVMDYSLLVGIDDDRHELVVGIVDFARTFTWDKQLESWVKETAFLGGGRETPTIVSPRVYKQRFRMAMDRYFLMVPDKFTELSFDTSQGDSP